MDIQYYIPTRIIMQEDCIVSNAAALKPFGAKALVVTGTGSAKINGSQDDVLKALEMNGQSYAIFDKVMSNPTVDCVYEGAAFARENAVDFVIAIGGGSPMDAAKAIALLTRQDIKREELFAGIYGEDVLPMVFIPTTAGTGSEVTPYSILTNDAAQTKTSIASPQLFPRLALLDARYTESLSLTTTINTAVDALSHAAEGMLTKRRTPIADMLARESLSLIASCFSALIDGTVTSKEREKLLYASTLAGMVITHTGTTIVHAMGYSLTYFKGVDHGRANGLLLGGFFRFIEKHDNAKMTEVLSAMSLMDVGAFETIIGKLLKEREEITAEEVEKFTKISLKSKNVNNTSIVPSREDIKEIYCTTSGSL